MENNKGETNMNTKPINDGGSAFPMGYHPEGNNADHTGMSLRDWFAGMAREEDIEYYLPDTMGELEKLETILGRTVDRVWARYAYADAMIAERKKGDLP